jgi:hypothetical protein
MIATMNFMQNGKSIFHYEFPLPSQDYIVGVPWADGVKAGIDEFRRACPGLSLFSVSLVLGTRP